MDNTTAPQLPAATLERINAIPNHGIRAYETELAYQQLAIEQAEAHKRYEQARRAHRLNSKPLVAEPIWWDALLLTLFVIACYVLIGFIDQHDDEDFPAAVATTAAVQHVRSSK